MFWRCSLSDSSSSRIESNTVNVGGYQLTWLERMIVVAAIIAMAETIKVAEPGVNNITEVLLMGAVAVVQIVLFALAAAKVPGLEIFANTEFLLLTIINVAQTVVAFQINAGTLHANDCLPTRRGDLFTSPRLPQGVRAHRYRRTDSGTRRRTRPENHTPEGQVDAAMPFGFRAGSPSREEARERAFGERPGMTRG